ncbi:unnamed protein product [Gulo gulo]|uniref:Uncharacterized protein n=1 Tax=Gulo gulo TaxID=48420 RepID=A0A9X9LE20_GULGU|nr:unnamed protein product [Gulo gulo]
MRTAQPGTQSAGGWDPSSPDESDQKEMGPLGTYGDRTEPAWCPVTVHSQTSLAVEGGSHLPRVAFSGSRPPGAQGPDWRGDHRMATPHSGLGHRDSLSVSGNHVSVERRGRLGGRLGAAWWSQLLLVAVGGPDWGSRGSGAIQWPTAPVLMVPIRRGIVPQEPALYSVPPQALGPHEPLCSQVPLLAEGRQLLVC